MTKILIRIGLIGSLAYLAGYATAAEYPLHAPMKVKPIFYAKASTKETSIIKRFNGLFMSISEKTPNLFYLLIRGEAITGKDQKIKLDDDDFIKAIQETKTNKLYQVRVKGGMLTHNAIDSLEGQNELRYLDLSNNKLITDLACKKIANYFPRLGRLNLYNTGITDKGLSYLIDLQELRMLHIGETQVSFKAANEFRGKMQSAGANEDLEITTGINKPVLGSIKHNKFLRSTYQTNVLRGKINPDYKVNILK